MSNPSDTDNLDVDNEIGAIKVILGALAPLSPTVRNNVLDYVLKRLGIASPVARVEPADPAVEPVRPADSQSVAPTADAARAVHIREFKEQKRPRSANEMAAVVAYYMAHVAAKRKTTINAKDIEDQFRIAEFPLPAQAKFTLVNARNAGYLNSSGGGEYELNAVGHNLVAHSLPRGEQDGTSSRRRKAAKRPRKSK